jgi:hypothetical protein
MYSVYQHWDPLKVCVVGRSYPPEFYSWITVPHVRSLFEKIAIETEEDYQGIIKKLQEFGVETLRPELLNDTFVNGKYLPPPMTPRDNMIMLGQTFYNEDLFDFKNFYKNVKDPLWPPCKSSEELATLPLQIQDECYNIHKLLNHKKAYNSGVYKNYNHIFDQIIQQGNELKTTGISKSLGASISRIGKDLYFSTENYAQNQIQYQTNINAEFPHTRNHIVNTGGHGDGTYCPVCPGLIISLRDVPTYKKTFPDWEVVYLPGQSWDKIQPFLRLKKRNQGRWWIPGFEHDNDVINVVEQWLGHWTGYVEETVFDVNMLIIDPKNVMVFNYNKLVFDTLDRYGITPHIVPFRHRFFWDGGIHCVTLDLHREGVMQDYFPQRG